MNLADALKDAFVACFRDDRSRRIPSVPGRSGSSAAVRNRWLRLDFR